MKPSWQDQVNKRRWSDREDLTFPNEEVEL
jgi:hypothetical protein